MKIQEHKPLHCSSSRHGRRILTGQNHKYRWGKTLTKCCIMYPKNPTKHGMVWKHIIRVFMFQKPAIEENKAQFLYWRASVWIQPICCSSVCLSLWTWIIHPCGLCSGLLYVCLSFLLLFVHLLCLSLRVFLCRCCPPPSSSLRLCLVVWPLVNPFCPCWPW